MPGITSPQAAAAASHFASLTPFQVHSHLLQAGIAPADAQLLLQEDVDGLSSPSLSHQHLQDMGIPTFGRRQRILLALSVAAAAPLSSPSSSAALLAAKDGPAAAAEGHNGFSHFGRPHSASPPASAAFASTAAAQSAAQSHRLPARPHSAQAIGSNAAASHHPASSPHYSPVPSLPVTPYEAASCDSQRGLGEEDEKEEREELRGRHSRRAQRSRRAETKREEEEAQLSAAEQRRCERERRAHEDVRWEEEQRERRHEQQEVLRLKEELLRREKAKQRIREAEADILHSQPAAAAAQRSRRRQSGSKPDRRAGRERRHDSEDETPPLSPPPPRPFPQHPAQPAPSSSPLLSPPALTPPSRSLQLEHVYGYTSSSSARNNLLLTGGGCAVYPAGRLGVVLDTRRGEAAQSFFTGHQGMLRALAQHPVSRSIVASSSSPLSSTSPPAVLVWDSAAVHATAVSLPLTAVDCGVRSLGFSSDGLHLATLSCDADCTLRVWHWATAALLASVHTAAASASPSSSSSPQVHTCRWNSQSPHQLVTLGRRHLAFWAFRDGRLKGQKAALPAASSPSLQYESLAFSAKGYACVGTSCGSVLVYTEPASPPRSFLLLDASCRLTCLEAWKGGLVAGGDDGSVVVVNRSMELMRRWQYDARVVAVAWKGEGECVVGTRDGRLWRMADVWAEGGGRAEGSRGELLTEGHYDGRLSALAAVDARRCVTAGEDNSLILWDTERRRAETRAVLGSSRGALSGKKAAHDSSQRALCAAAGGGLVAVGIEDGHVLVFSSPALKPLHRVHVEQAVQQSGHRDSRATAASSSAAITCVSFSPAPHHLLAVGSADGAALLFAVTASACSLLSLCCPSSAAVVHMDWSASASALQVTDAVTASCFLSVCGPERRLALLASSAGASAVRHSSFPSVSSPLSFATHALFTTVPSKHIGQCIVATRGGEGEGEEGLCCLAGLGGGLRLYRYTGLCATGQQWREVAAHAGRVGNARWLSSRRLLTVGRDDLTVMQWRVV